MSDILRLYRAAWLSRRGVSSWLGGQAVACIVVLLIGVPHPYLVLGMISLYGLYHAGLQIFLLMKRPSPGEQHVGGFEEVKLSLFLDNACRSIGVMSFGLATLTIWLLAYFFSQMS